MSTCQAYASIWPADQQDIAQAVCQAESGGSSGAIGDNGDSIGLWQINLPSHPQYTQQQLLDPSANAIAALGIWQSSGWGPWSTFNSGAYRQYLTGASGRSTSDGISQILQPAGGGINPLLVLAGLGLGLLILANVL